MSGCEESSFEENRKTRMTPRIPVLWVEGPSTSIGDVATS